MSNSARLRRRLFWPKIVLKKWLNVRDGESDFSADTEGDDISDLDEEGSSQLELPWMVRRRKSETLRQQYINSKELRICVGTWNVGGRVPNEDLNITEWLDVEEPADIYIVGLQEVVPLNAGNIFGQADSHPVTKWEHVIRECLNRVPSIRAKHTCYSVPASPSQFMRTENDTVTEDENFDDSDIDNGDEFHHLGEEALIFGKDRDVSASCVKSSTIGKEPENAEDSYSGDISNCPTRLNRLNCLKQMDDSTTQRCIIQLKPKLTKTLSSSERISLSWPEKPLDLLSCHVARSDSFSLINSFKTSSLSRSSMNGCSKELSTSLLKKLVLESVVQRKKATYARIVSKQMVGVYLSIWVRKSLRKHIHNLSVSTVGVGVMGYLGNKSCRVQYPSACSYIKHCSASSVLILPLEKRPVMNFEEMLMSKKYIAGHISMLKPLLIMKG